MSKWSGPYRTTPGLLSPVADPPRNARPAAAAVVSMTAIRSSYPWIVSVPMRSGPAFLNSTSAYRPVLKSSP